MEDAALTPTSSPFIEVRESNIHGTGVFAAIDIPSSTRIIEYVGRRVKKDDLQNLPPEARYYTHRLDDDYYVDGSPLYNTARFINHTCNPNICSETVLDKGHIWFYSSRWIRRGEELSYDYNYGLVKDMRWLEERRCLCGDKDCVGYMVGNIFHAELRNFLKEHEREQGKTKPFW